MKWRKVYFRQVDLIGEVAVNVNHEIGGRYVSDALLGCARKVWQAVGFTRQWKAFYATALTKREAKRKLDSWKPK